MSLPKGDIVNLFLKRGILSCKTGLVRRPYCWKQRFGDEEKRIFDDFAKGYRSQEEAWFCLCRDIELPICPICKKEKVRFTGLTKNGGKGYNTTCEHCSANAAEEKVKKVKDSLLRRTECEKEKTQEKRRKTNLSRYGEERYMSYGSLSFKRLMKERYGNPFYSNMEKRKETCIQRYGVSSNLLIPKVQRRAMESAWSDSCRKRRVETCLSKTGKKYYCEVPEIQRKMIGTKKAKIKEIEDSLSCTLMATVTKKYGQGYKRLGLEYLRIGGRVYIQNKDLPAIIEYSNEGTHTNKYTSKPEKEVLEYVKSIYNGMVEENCTSIVPNGNHRFFELDIYIPELKLAIDFDGTYYHSTKFKDEMYHARKTDYCRRVGVKMIHIFEDAWKSNRKMCEWIIRECINGTFRNVIREEGDIVVGDNSLPVFGDFEIVGITCPKLCAVGNVAYYDCGDILYRKRGE